MSLRVLRVILAADEDGPAGGGLLFEAGFAEAGLAEGFRDAIVACCRARIRW